MATQVVDDIVGLLPVADTDTDYFAQHMHNCFIRSTKFITPDGVKSFEDFDDGDKVKVFDKDGVLRDATVHCYGKKTMQLVWLVKELDNNTSENQAFICTKDHRWILQNGNVTTNIKQGDRLYIPKGVHGHPWTVKKIENYGLKICNTAQKFDAWCVEEPITHSFTLVGEIPTGNCDLVNLEDMLQNGTVISGTMIEKPHSFSTACNITTQIIAQVGSSQFGGQTITLSHLVPFVDISRQRIRKQVDKEQQFIKERLSDEEKEKIVDSRLAEEINRGIQMIQYQLITLSTTNG